MIIIIKYIYVVVEIINEHDVWQSIWFEEESIYSDSGFNPEAKILL